MLIRATATVATALAAALLAGLPAQSQTQDQSQTAVQCPEGNYELVIVSWGGAYEASQEKAYYQPYMKACPNVSIVQESASNEAVAKLRAQAEAGNVTWDVVDTLISDAIRLCDEGLVLEIDHDEWLAPAPDGTPASEDMADSMQSDCFIPNIVYSTLLGYRTNVPEWEGKEPEDVCALFDLENFRMGALLRRRRQGGNLRRPRHRGGPAAGARQARHHQGPDHLVVGRRRDAPAVGGRGGRDRLDL
jgi:spermidine/putrescine-binding protein